VCPIPGHPGYRLEPIYWLLFAIAREIDLLQLATARWVVMRSSS